MSGVLGAIEAGRHVLAGLIILVGLTGLGASLAGQMRFPDLFTRLHAAALTPISAALILGGLALESWNAQIAVRLALLAVLMLVLAPVRTHLLANAAHGAGLAPLVGRLAASAAKSAK